MNTGCTAGRGRPRKSNPLRDTLDAIKLHPHCWMTAGEQAEAIEMIEASEKTETEIVGRWRGKGTSYKLALEYALIREYSPEEQNRIREAYKKSCDVVLEAGRDGAKETRDRAVHVFEAIISKNCLILDKVFKGEWSEYHAATILAERCGYTVSVPTIRRHLRRYVRTIPNLLIKPLRQKNLVP